MPSMRRVLFTTMMKMTLILSRALLVALFDLSLLLAIFDLPRAPLLALFDHALRRQQGASGQELSLSQAPMLALHYHGLRPCQAASGTELLRAWRLWRLACVE